MDILIALLDLVDCQKKKEQKDENVEEEEEEYMMTTRRRNKMKAIGSWVADIGMGSSPVCFLL